MGTPERQDRLADPRSEVWVTITVAPRRHLLESLRRALSHLSRARGVTRWLAALAAAAALAGGAVGELAGSATRAGDNPAGFRAEAAAYRFPLGCLGASLSGQASRGSDAATSRTGPCWHYGVYVTAVLRHVRGVWRLMLAARSDSCPNVQLPAAIRGLLVACAKSAREHGRDRRTAQAVGTALDLRGGRNHPQPDRLVDRPPHRVAIDVAQP